MICLRISFFIILLILFNTSSIANVKKSTSQRRTIKIFELKKELKRHAKSIQKIEGMISGVQKDLNSKSKYYFKVINSRREIEEEVRNRSKLLKKNELKLKIAYKKTQRVLKVTILKIFDKNSSPSDLLSAKILIKHLKVRIVNLQNSILNNQLLLKKLRAAEDQYQKQIDVEIELAQFLHDLEIKKNDLERKREDEILLKKSIGKQVTISEIQRRKKRKYIFNKTRIKSKFKSPILSYDREEHRKKGISFSYSRRQPVYAPLKGEVVVSRGLSTFGKVVMIDHGKGVRSVILGTFIPSVLHGTKVDKGSVIGYTEVKQKLGKLYFEVRRDSKAYNTYKLMDKNFYKKPKKFHFGVINEKNKF